MVAIKPHIHSVTAFAPATCANVAVGFDILGFALENVGDSVTLTRRDDNKIIIESIHSDEPLPSDTDKNTASIVIKRLCQELKLEVGFSIQLQKGIPLCSGMGGSAASAVAALIACNAFLDPPLSQYELAHYALFGEELASGQPHADNIVPCIFGGLTLIHSFDPIEIIQLPVPNIHCALIHPHLFVSTKQARKILKQELLLHDYIKQSANLSAFIAALYTNDLLLVRKSLIDVLIEPQRAQFVPGFYKMKNTALELGALGMSFSGSGPSIFAWATQKEEAQSICIAISDQLKQEKIESDYWISSISKVAAHVSQTVKR